MKQLYLALAKRLLAIADRTGKRLIQHVDLLDFARNGAVAHDFPAVYIDIPTLQWQQMGNKVQRAENAIIRCYVVQQTMADTYQNQTGGSSNLELAMALYDVIDDVYLALQNFQHNGENDYLAWSRLCRTATSVDTAIFEGAVTYVLHFATTITDTTGQREILYIELPAMEVEVG